MQHAKPVKMNSKWAKQNHILVKRLKNEIPGHKFIMKNIINELGNEKSED